MKICCKKSIHTTTVIELHIADVFSALRKIAPLIPSNAKLVFQVPSGGDYSGCELEVEDLQLSVVYETFEQEED